LAPLVEFPLRSPIARGNKSKSRAARVMTPKFVTVIVEEHDTLPEGCCQRFKIAAAAPRIVHRVRYEPDGASASAVYLVESPGDDGMPTPVWAADVEDSGAGTSTLVFGGTRGLRLVPVEGGPVVPEPYLLVASAAIRE
jgi:hypothetical protein